MLTSIACAYPVLAWFVELYVEYALKAARTGQLEAALDVALETVGHVSVEDPRPHLLIGELAVLLRDPTLLQERRRFFDSSNTSHGNKSLPWWPSLDEHFEDFE